MKREEYRAYLESPEWRAKREWAIERAGGLCQVCNGNGELHVHHRTYARVGAEWPVDLTVLCKACHERFHDKVPGNGAAKYRPRKWSEVLYQWVFLMVLQQDRSYVLEAALVVKEEHFEDAVLGRVYGVFLDDPGFTEIPDGLDEEAAWYLDGLLRMRATAVSRRFLRAVMRELVDQHAAREGG